MENQTFVSKYSDHIMTDAMLADLIPGFLKNKRDDVLALSQAIKAADYETFKKTGHKWKGACASYGFHYLGDVGKQFEELAEQKNSAQLMVLLESLTKYLANIELEFTSTPTDQ